MSEDRKIEDYALIGDERTAALVSRAGSIDWLCLPRFDSPACFASLLGNNDNGCWSIAPVGENPRITRRYDGDTLVLQTDFETETGTVRVTDFMPRDTPTTSVIRKVTGLSGRVPMKMGLTIRFDYGRLVPWVSRREDGALTAMSGPHLLILRSSVETHGADHSTTAEFTVSEGETMPFVLTYCDSYLDPPDSPDCDKALEDTLAWWRDWVGKCTYQGPWREAVVRSLITLKALTYASTGGIVAAPTTSLPEQIGGERNWDYRFCWLRDATFTLLSLMAAGYREEADSWRGWLLRAIAGNANQVQPLYTILGENRAEEWEVPWLAGFSGSQPVRIGNGAFAQTQLDVFGEVLDALHHARRADLGIDGQSWELQMELLHHLENVLDEKDRGIWEVRGDKRHFTHSRVMMWVAFDRAVTAVEEFGLDGPVETWRKLRDQLHAEICEKGFDPELGAFVQAYGSKALDAALLLIPIVGFLPADDERVAGTVRAIEDRLIVDGFVRRYDTAEADDGLEGHEGVFLACSFWLADNYVLQGRLDKARELYERLLALRNDVGLLAEEYDPASNVQLGNFPQALSHLTMVDTAFNLANHNAPAQSRAKHGPEGEEENG